jgi:mono/diheme cytochrome c family protein
MKRLAVLGIAVCVVLLAAYAGITLYDRYFRFGRMWETPAVKPHETPLPVMPRGNVPVDGGEAVFRIQEAHQLENPDPDRSRKRRFAGKTAYIRYCIHCHGNALDGQGTVGQSFSPLARDLKSPRIQEQKDGQWFYSISYGKNRMPALATTVSIPERWDIVVYLRAAAAGQIQGPR